MLLILLINTQGGFTELHPQICFQLLERLTSKGKRQPEFTRELIKNKLTDDEDGIATTNLKVQIYVLQSLLGEWGILFNLKTNSQVTVSCPLGKMRMSMPCRPTTCDHLQVFKPGYSTRIFATLSTVLYSSQP